jgi:hypothetical protein
LGTHDSSDKLDQLAGTALVLGDARLTGSRRSFLRDIIGLDLAG